MELLERYLQAIKFFLPRREQEDILRELRENLQSQIDDKAEALGRSLQEEEVAEILRAHGHPLVVAGQYREKGLLIGTTWYPIYLLTLQIGLLVALIVTVVLGLVNAAMHEADMVRNWVRTMMGYPGRALMVFAWTTLVFAGLERAQAAFRFNAGWDPRKLPKIGRPQDRLSRTNTSVELVFTIAAVAWLLLLPAAPWLALGPGVALMDPAPIWGGVYPTFLLMALGWVAVSVMDLVRPYKSRERSYARLGLHGLSFAIMLMLLRVGEWVVPKAHIAVQHSASAERLIGLVNQALLVNLIVALVITAIEIIKDLRGLRKQQGATEAIKTAVRMW